MMLLCTMCILVFAIHAKVFAQTVGVFYNSNVEPIKFAAGDVKSALESKGFTVEMFSLSSLSTTYSNKKVVIALTSDNAVKSILTTQGGATPSGLGEQAYGLRTTTAPEKTFWVIGGDINGAMYGGLQIAENIKFDGFSGTYNNQESPKILKRGIKLNLPFDLKSPTYFSSNNSTASRNAISNVWDMSFWTTWFDEMARYRYNVLSVWNNHPFTSMIKLPDYPNVALNNVTGYPDIYNDNDNTGVVIKTMTIDQKIEFWQNVMAYAKDRGFSFYLINWNLFLSNAKGLYGMTDGSVGVTNQATIAYMRKCMYELLKTYPNLDGFGVTEGEGMSDNDEANSLFLGSTYGKGMADFAKENPQRKLNFIHRWHMADFTLIKKNFAELFACPNVTFDMSFKYSSAHMYSSVTPEIMSASNINALKTNNIKTWFTVRNDDFYYHNWGDPNYARTYINNIPGLGDWSKGFYIGSDGFHQTRTFFSKNSVTQGQLEIQRLWYMNMIWGRLAFNPNTPDDVFKNYMNLKYPEVATNELFTAWSKASSGLPKVGEILFGNLNLDFHWYPENCQDKDGFLTIADFAAANPRSVTTLCGITNSAENICGTKTSTYAMADQIEADALAALSLVETVNANANSELGVAINNIKSMSYLTIYYAYKIRGATFNKATNKKPEAINALGRAYCWWKKYTNLMDANFTGMSCQRVAKFATWHQHDAAVLKEYTDLGGTGAPICGDKSFKVNLSSNDDTKGIVAGFGLYNQSDEVTITAVPKPGYRFLYWKENNTVVSSNLKYKFTIESDKEFIAYFVESDGCAFPWNDAGITVNKTTVTKTFGPIDISCAPGGVIISADLEGVATDNSDYCRIFYKIDGGVEIPIAQLNGPFSLKTVSASGVKGNKLEIIVRCATSWADEFYHITNIKVDNIITSNKLIQLDDIEIYPNPASKILYIVFPDDVGVNRKVTIFNAMGQMVYATQTKSSKLELNVKSLNLKGLMLVNIETDKKVLNYKIFVQ